MEEQLESIRQLLGDTQQSLYSLNDGIDRIGSGLLLYALALAAIGTIAMALLEFGKNVGRARRWFNKKHVHLWVRDRDALEELELLSIGAHANRGVLYDQPVEKIEHRHK